MIKAMRWIVCVVLFGGFSYTESDRKKPRPVVLMHGYGSNADIFKYKKQQIEMAIPGIYVLPLQLGETLNKDRDNVLYLNMYEQVAYACRLIRSNVELQEGYNAVGWSHGGLLMRAVAQKCPEPRVFNLISLGGPQQGIYGIPKGTDFRTTLNFLSRHTNILRWECVKREYAALHYWHDPRSHGDKTYREENNFIAEMNNESDPINQFYKRNLLRLQNFVLVKFALDENVMPPATQWFEFYKPGQRKKILPLEESRLWKEDRLGLRQLKEEGKLHTINVQDGHLEFSDEWFTEEIIDKYLR